MKIVVIGSSDVGKSCMVRSYCKEPYTPCPTLGEVYKVAIWDTAGQERFRAISSSYYREVDGVLVVFDLGNQHSFDEVPHWIQECKDNTSSREPILFLVGNKRDMVRCVSRQDAIDLVESLEPNVHRYYEVSSYNHEEVRSMFNAMIQLILQRGTSSITDRVDIVQPSRYCSC